MTIWRMRISCWIPKAKNTHTGSAILIAFPLEQWLQKRVSMLRYTYIACLVTPVFPKSVKIRRIFQFRELDAL
jgi:hypothetical protein